MLRPWTCLTAVLLFASVPVGLSAGAAAPADDWFAFAPPVDEFRESPLDLRHLNERFAGEHGPIAARGAEFVFSATQEPVRFWAVNGPPEGMRGAELKQCARRLAKYGVNLVRMHGALFDRVGEASPAKVAHAQEVVEAMKEQGIYTHFSVYFPLWMSPAADHPWLRGYDGKTHPFAALLFNPEFQSRYREWWRALLLTTNAQNGRRLVDEPAVFGLELQNEDSFFFWTFNPERLPDAQMRLLEEQFGDWLKQRYGTLDAALARWHGQKTKRDNSSEGRMGFRPLYNMFTEKSPRDRDTVRFLIEKQRAFYIEMRAFLRALGFQGVITASNWATASPEIFGPLEKWSYAVTDFIDRHGYFSVTHQGDNSAWSLRHGHTYSDRSALRFEPAAPGKPKQFVHPVMDPSYDGKPSMLSETTWNRPNRFRSEAPLYLAAYGALQGSDAIVHFALDGGTWSVKPRFWMQPWTLMAPSQMAQFPAAALLYRNGLVRPGEVLARIELNTNDLMNLSGTPLPQDASFDELRLKDVPTGLDVKAGQRLDPLIHYAGRVEVFFTNTPGRVMLADLKPWLERSAQRVRSSTRELELDYDKGVLRLNSPNVQGVSGNLHAAGLIELHDITVESASDNLHLVLVSLERLPLSQSKRMLLQVMSEEEPTGFATEEAGSGLRRIKDIGRDPWRVKALRGEVKFKGAERVSVQPLDFNGYPHGPASQVSQLKLARETLYYLVTR